MQRHKGTCNSNTADPLCRQGCRRQWRDQRKFLQLADGPAGARSLVSPLSVSYLLLQQQKQLAAVTPAGAPEAAVLAAVWQLHPKATLST